jgi:Pyridoxamine 5'-phosphate oxidase
MSADPRSRAQRRRDTEHRLTDDIDLWVASASADGAPYLVPLSFDWDGEALLVATPTDSPTGRNLAATRTVRLGLGHTRDVSMIEGEVEVLEIDALPRERGDRFAARTGFDPRALATPYRWFRISPRRIQAWREVNELPDRELMRDGRWLVGRLVTGLSEVEPDVLLEAGEIEPSDAGGDREGGPAQQMEAR